MERFKIADARSAAGGPSSSATPARARFDPTAARSWTSYLNCPSCGLSLRVRPSHVAIVHCPRCAGRGD
ncbi:MAG TPA: hypothetical protein VFR49_12575, partial [Solirubrobacteraceae bacterium]|nr:hypothetical protein [Solirubrobacteraceae bacterium]